MRTENEAKLWDLLSRLLVIGGFASIGEGVHIITGEPGVLWITGGVIAIGFGVVLLFVLASEARD